MSILVKAKVHAFCSLLFLPLLDCQFLRLKVGLEVSTVRLKPDSLDCGLRLFVGIVQPIGTRPVSPYSSKAIVVSSTLCFGTLDH